MRNGPQGFQNAFQQVIRQEQGIAAGKDDVPYFAVLAQISDGPVEFPFLEEAGLADEPFARAEPAVDRALVGDHQ